MTKKQSDAWSISYVTTLLSNWSFSVHRVPPAESEKRADLLASVENERYIIEIKTRDNPEDIKDLIAAANQEGTAHIGRQVNYRNKYSRLLRDASMQLANTSSYQGDFRIAWFILPESDWEYQSDVLSKTTFGLRTVRIHDGDVEDPWRRCYYYDPGEFYRQRDVDAVVVSIPTGVRLLLNNFSPRADSLRGSSLFSRFSEEDAAEDPVALERQGRAYVITDDIDRDGGGSHKYLLKKYGMLTTPLIEHRFDGWGSINLNE